MLSHLESPEQLALRWGVPKSWIYSRTRKTGPDALPHIKMGKYIKIEAAVADKWLLKRGKNYG